MRRTLGWIPFPLLAHRQVRSVRSLKRRSLFGPPLGAAQSVLYKFLGFRCSQPVKLRALRPSREVGGKIRLETYEFVEAFSDASFANSTGPRSGKILLGTSSSFLQLIDSLRPFRVSMLNKLVLNAEQNFPFARNCARPPFEVGCVERTGPPDGGPAHGRVASGGAWQTNDAANRQISRRIGGDGPAGVSTTAGSS